MATSGTGTPSAKEPKEDQTGVGATVGGGLPADGRDMGATVGASDTARAGGAQAARERATKNGARPKEQLCLSKQRKRLRSWRN